MEHERKDTNISGAPAKAEAEEYPRRDVKVIGVPASAGAAGKVPDGS